MLVVVHAAVVALSRLGWPPTDSNAAFETAAHAPKLAPMSDARPSPSPSPCLIPSPIPVIGTGHQRRLRAVWHSAGWPYQDLLEVELLAAGLLQRQQDAQGRETVRVTDAGLQLLHRTLLKNRAARDDHEQLVASVARAMQRAGRVVWRGLSLRARVGGYAAAGGDAAAEPAWSIAMPDVYSIRHTTLEDHVEPVAHEIKVRRADLLADLRRPAKGEAYRWLSGECWYVLREGIAQPEEIPLVYGVLLADAAGSLSVARPAPRRPMRLPFMVWMALARATPDPQDDDAQPGLGVSDPPAQDAPPAA